MKHKQNPLQNNTIHQLSQMGWTSHFQTQLEPLLSEGLIPARVIGMSQNKFRTNDGKNEGLATLSGRLKHPSNSMYPVTGDWVLMNDSVIVRILNRKNALSRGASGSHNKKNTQPQKEQIIAANLDSIFIVTGLDRDFNLRRIERYLTLVYNCCLTPVIILTKADLHTDPEHFVNEVESVAFDVPIHLVAASSDTDLIALAPYLSSGRTTTMVGSSGAGKSTLVNRLCGKTVQLTASISSHVGKGKHTTTSRDLIMLPQGGMIIDNPGIREIAFWDVESGIEIAFPEIEALAHGCRYRNCSHSHEPNCLVLKAVADGNISEGRLENYRKMKREMEYLAQRRNKSGDRLEKERWKSVALKIRDIKKER